MYTSLEIVELEVNMHDGKSSYAVLLLAALDV